MYCSQQTFGVMLYESNLSISSQKCYEIICFCRLIVFAVCSSVQTKNNAVGFNINFTIRLLRISIKGPLLINESYIITNYIGYIIQELQKKKKKFCNISHVMCVMSSLILFNTA